LLADCFKTVADGPMTGLLAARAISTGRAAHNAIDSSGKTVENVEDKDLEDKDLFLQCSCSV